jgi:hypothetical protein
MEAPAAAVDANMRLIMERLHKFIAPFLLIRTKAWIEVG